MKTHIIENGIIINTIMASVDETLLAYPDVACLDAAIGGGIGDTVINGVVIPKPVPDKTPEELQQEVTQATQKRLDDFAQTKNYDSMLSACTYATSAVSRLQTEGQYCVESRDNTWQTLYTILAKIEAGSRPMPSGYDEIEQELPALAWP